MAAIAAQGTTLKIVTTAGAITISDVLSITAPSVSVTTIEASNLDSTWKTFIGGLKDGGDLTFELAYDPSDSGHQQILADAGAGELACTVTWSDAKTTEFGAIITSLSTGAAMDDKLTLSATMKITGSVTFPTA